MNFVKTVMIDASFVKDTAGDFALIISAIATVGLILVLAGLILVGIDAFDCCRFLGVMAAMLGGVCFLASVILIPMRWNTPNSRMEYIKSQIEKETGLNAVDYDHKSFVLRDNNELKYRCEISNETEDGMYYIDMFEMNKPTEKKIK